MPKKTRYYYLDILKFIAIFLVCSYHFTWAGDLSYAENMPALTVFKRGVFGIGSMCIPLFFMVNGSLLLNREMDLHKHIKNSIVLLLQYFFWRFITIVILAGYNGLTLPQVGKMNLLKAVFCYENIEGIRYNHLWFIPTLL
ncbi:MAG: acyltransferase family protein, partial [Oscillospiraceae bacterium]